MSPGPISAVESLTAVAAITAARDSGLLRALERFGPTTAADLAARAHLSPRGVELVVDALVEIGAVVKVCGTEEFRLVGAAAGWNALSSLTPGVAALLEGRPGATSQSSSPHAYRSVVAILGLMTTSVIGPWVAARARPNLRVLEVGCGDAPWTRALASVEPAIQATLVDHPEVLAATADRLVNDLPTTHIALLPGDAHTDPLAGPYDLVIVAGFCRLFGETTNQRLFRRLRDTVTDRGELLVVDAVEFNDRSKLGLYRLSLAARRPNGSTWSIGHYRQWLSNAGFGQPSVQRSARPELTLLAAQPIDETSSVPSQQDG